ncbi:MAG: hypothetical protein IRY97_08785 [Thermomicrobiaceae bacterium]|nr:hypothetical protein [Thermomicrobiaceae bacterium]
MTPEGQLLIARIHPGMDVCDSEGAKIGQVAKIYMAADYGNPPARAWPTVTEPYLRVATDAKELYIPSSYVSDVTPDCVVLNTLRANLDEQGWDQRPDFLRD